MPWLATFYWTAHEYSWANTAIMHSAICQVGETNAGNGSLWSGSRQRSPFLRLHGLAGYTPRFFYSKTLLIGYEARSGRPLPCYPKKRCRSMLFSWAPSSLQDLLDIFVCGILKQWTDWTMEQLVWQGWVWHEKFSLASHHFKLKNNCYISLKDRCNGPAMILPMVHCETGQK